ncbi:MAG: molecular chaperone DnaJ [Candidatus Synoicihabitans palmerolidicus]|nr:molecular chaperone DnaJ [Candidatus Synoicihabitans palmerolidicus]
MSAARIQQFQKLVDQQPGNDLFRFSFAQALDTGGHALQAVPHYERCVAARADWMMPRILLGKALLKLGQTDQAKPILGNALQLALDQDHEDPAAELSALLQSLGRA